MNPTIADTGVIAAFLNPKDQWREWTVNQWRQLPAPFLTCEAVVTEACFLLHHFKDGEQDVLSLVEAGILQIDFSLSSEALTVKTLMKKYENVPMSLADACLVRMSELIDNSVVFTADSDFHIYRKNGRQKISLIIPE
ncbi:MAG: PIN domain-containing protein [Acidobacteria bacterium]|nr:PIN domain-containing protein [Acidobacteriota bacterium]